MILLDKNTNQKLYPVCSFENNQHKLDYFIVKCENDRMDALIDGDDKAAEILDKKVMEYNRLMDLMTNGVYKDGLVYMPYSDGQKLKEIVAEYDSIHGKEF